MDPLHRALSKRHEFYPGRIRKKSYPKEERILRTRWKQRVCDWIESAVRQYRAWYHDEECTIMLCHDGSNGITFMMPRTLELVRHTDICHDWDLYLLSRKPNAEEMEQTLRDIYRIFCERHPRWWKTWHHSDDDDDEHECPSLEVDDHGYVWCFRWRVASKK